MGIQVISPGLFTTVQDQGRYGFQSLGFSTSGVMDQHAFRLANLLLDNPAEAAGLELTGSGPTLKFTRRNLIAITGGEFSPLVNGQAVPSCTALLLNRNDTLSFGAVKSGFRAYIAFAGGLDLPLLMGSRATHTKCALGGLAGRPLKSGDHLRFCSPREHLPYLGSRCLPNEVFQQDEEPLRVIPGPQEDYFTAAGRETFYGSVFTLSNECDRMGARLTGPAVALARDADIISDGIALGAIQIPSHGHPIVMLADRQTTGGYPKIGAVATVDLPKLTQRKPGDQVRFTRCSVEEAQQLLRQEEDYFAQLRERIHQPHRRVMTYTIESLS